MALNLNAGVEARKSAVMGNGARAPFGQIGSISPATKKVGDAPFVLTVTGTNFVASDIIVFGGVNQTTTFGSATSLTATVNLSAYTAARPIVVQVRHGSILSAPKIFMLTPPTATGATAGTPGSFTPDGSTPATLAALQGLGALGQTTAWTTGEFVVLGDESEAHWNGTAWAAGKAP